MFFFLSKLLAFLIMPFNWFLILAIWAWRTKDAVRKRKLIIAATFVIVIFSNRMLFDRVMHVWEINTINTPPENSYDGIIVLGGMTQYDKGYDRIQFMRGSDRIWQAIALWKKGVAPKVIFSGGSGSVLHPDHMEGIFIKRYLDDLGIPDSVMIYESKSKNTHENAVMTKPYLDKLKKNGKYLLVTSAFHMRRALGCFTKEGINVSPFSADRYSGEMKWDFDYLFMPDSETLFNWNQLFHEWFGCITYKMSGYL